MDDCVGAGGVADSLARGKDSCCQHQQGCGGGKGCFDHFLCPDCRFRGYSLIVELSRVVELGLKKRGTGD